MMELEELAIALNWTGVYHGQDCPVIQFDVSQVQQIQGLRATPHCYYLAYPEYTNALISFQVTNGPDDLTQYWVLGDRLHRSSGPAKISYNGKSRVAIADYYQNGLRHKLDGPASITLTNVRYSNLHPVTGEDMGEDYMVEVWEEMESYWHHYGEPAKYPAPHSMICKDGFRVYRTTSETPVLSDFKDTPALVANAVYGNWGREGSVLEDDPFRLRWMVAKGYSRRYTHGEPKEHRCDTIEQMEWVMSGELVSSTVETRERIRRDLFSEFNIWEGPLFPNAQETMMAFAEVSRG
jgi:hypothetical protein